MNAINRRLLLSLCIVSIVGGCAGLVFAQDEQQRLALIVAIVMGVLAAVALGVLLKHRD